MPSRIVIVTFDDDVQAPPYAAAKRQAATDANAGREHVMQYNARKQEVVRQIYRRAFTASGLI